MASRLLVRNQQGFARVASVQGLPGVSAAVETSAGAAEHRFTDQVRAILDEVANRFAAGRADAVFDFGSFRLKVARGDKGDRASHDHQNVENDTSRFNKER